MKTMRARRCERRRLDERRWRGRVRAWLAWPVVLAMVGASATAVFAQNPPSIASGGFGRPVALTSVASSGDVRVAVVGSMHGPKVAWEDERGLVLGGLDGSTPDRWVDSYGVRAVWGGTAGGDPVLVWQERNLVDGGDVVRWAWRGDTRELLRTRQTIRLSVVDGGSRPAVVTATPGGSGWTIRPVTWDGDAGETVVRSETVASLDAVRIGDDLHVAWLEGRSTVVLGRLDADWNTWWARWTVAARTDVAGDERREVLEQVDLAKVAPARRLGNADTVVIAEAAGQPRIAWTRPDGAIVVSSVTGADAWSPGQGTVLGRLNERWTWIDGVDVFMRSGPGDDPERIVRLPARPEWIEGATHQGVTAIVWSAGKYLGGLDVWAVSNADGYRATFMERLAWSMGWDPWRPWSSLGGHLLTSLLVAVLVAMACTPAWWLVATLASRTAGTGVVRAVAEGTALGLGTVLAFTAFVATRPTFDAATVRALTGGLPWVVAASLLAILVSWFALRRADVEPTMRRLFASWTSSVVAASVLGVGTMAAWQRLFGAG